MSIDPWVRAMDALEKEVAMKGENPDHEPLMLVAMRAQYEASLRRSDNETSVAGSATHTIDASSTNDLFVIGVIGGTVLGFLLGLVTVVSGFFPALSLLLLGCLAGIVFVALREAN